MAGEKLLKIVKEYFAKPLVNLYLLPIRYIPKLRTYAWYWLFGGSHVQTGMSLAKKHLSQGDVIVDVGAFKGEKGDSTQLFCANFPNNIVFAFEPMNESFRSLQENTKKFRNVRPVQQAVSDKVGYQELQITNNECSSSLLSINEDVMDGIWGEFTKKKGAEKVSVTTLDDYFSDEPKHVALLKIDVQGNELRTLKGATKTLSNTKVITLEMSNHLGYDDSSKYFEVDEFLRERGFLLYCNIPSCNYNTRAIEWDSIYINSSCGERRE